MQDLSNTIEAKSDQLNAIDLVGGPKTIKITAVNVISGDQPVAINYESDNGKSWKPSKSMRRVLVSAWGPDGSAYVGRSLTLYNDPTVTWAGKEVGGIRISHLSDIDKDLRIPIQVKRGKIEPMLFKKLVLGKSATDKELKEWENKFLEVKDSAGIDVLTKLIGESNFDKPSRNAIMEFYKAALGKIK